MNLRPSVVAAAMAAAALVGANGAAIASTGQALILGHTNSAGAATVVQRTTGGPAFSLKVKSGSAPLAVNSATRVVHLNADLLDGQHASQLAPRAIRYHIPTLASATGRVNVSLTGLPHGIYLASYSIVATVNPTSTAVACYLSRDGGTTAELMSYGVVAGWGYSSANGSGVLDYRTGSQASLTCFVQTTGSFNFANESDNEDVVTLVPISALSIQNATPAVAPLHTRSGGATG